MYISEYVYREERSLFMHEYYPEMSIYKSIYTYMMMSIEQRSPAQSCMNTVLTCLSINVYIV